MQGEEGAQMYALLHHSPPQRVGSLRWQGLVQGRRLGHQPHQPPSVPHVKGVVRV